MHHKLSFRRKLQIFLLSLLLILLTAAGVPSAAYTAEAASADTTMAVHFLDVGQGLSVLVQSQGQNLLYDGGDRGHSSFVVSYLQKQNVSTIDYMISSHYDEDHVAGLVGCLDSFSVKNVIGADYIQDTKIYQSFENSVSSQGLNVQHPNPGTDFSFGSGKFTILSPQSISSNDNDNSVAIRLENGSNHFLFTGDAESAGEEAICNLGLDLSCDVIVPGHHGSATATTWDLLQQTVPEYAVISCGAGNSYGHPHKDTMDKLSDMGIQVFRTDEQGTVIAVSDGSDIQWNQNPCNDYSAGDATDIGTQPSSAYGSSSSASSDYISDTAASADSSANVQADPEPVGDMVWISATGSKYHRIPNCGNMNPDNATEMTRSQAEAAGYGACKKCY